MTTRKSGDGSINVRVGQSFTMGETVHHSRLLEAVADGNMELAKRLLHDPIGVRVRRKFLAMRDRCRAELAAAEQRIPFTPTGKEVV
jgi:FAD synthase